MAEKPFQPSLITRYPYYVRRATARTVQRSTQASDQHSKFPFTKPIRKIVEPPIIGEIRQLHLQIFKHSTSAGAGAEHLHLHEADLSKSILLYRPGLDIKNQNKPRPPVTSNPFRDIFYNPPIGSEEESSPSTPKVQHPSNTSRNSEPHPNPIHGISTLTLPYMNLSFRRQAQKRISPSTQQQQRPSFSTSTARPNADAASSPEPLDLDRYHRLADTYIDSLVAKLEEIQEERDEVDCEYSVRFLIPPPFSPAPFHIIESSLT
ncbi:MAG: hypothetical protein Q9210_007555, partial [Variospora velana]